MFMLDQMIVKCFNFVHSIFRIKIPHNHFHFWAVISEDLKYLMLDISRIEQKKQKSECDLLYVELCYGRNFHII